MKPTKVPLRFFVGLLLVVSFAAVGLADQRQIVLKQHCLDCHSGEESEAGLDLASLQFDLGDEKTFRQWVRVFDKVARGEMPPDEPVSEDPQVAKFLRELASELKQADIQRQRSQGRANLRRLNRAEFEHTLGDLLGIPLQIRELLPPDAKGHGFDTVGEALNISAVQMEAYLEAIDSALDSATHLIEKPERRKYRLSYLQTAGIMHEYRRTGPFLPQSDGVAMFAPDYYSHFNSLLDTYVVPHSARYRVKVSAYSIRSKSPVTLTVRMGGPGHKESDEVRKHLLGNVSVHAGDPQVFEFEDYLERGQMFRIYPSSLRKMRFAGKQWQLKQPEYKGPAVVVQWVEVDGPIYESWPPPEHQRLYSGVASEPIPGIEPNRDRNAHLNRPPDRVAKPRLTARKPNKETGNSLVYDPKQAIGGEKIYPRTRINEPLRSTRRLVPTDPRADAQRLLRSFVAAAYRRPVTEQDVQPFVALAHHWLDAGIDFESCMRTAYKAVLTSPDFLYHQSWRAKSRAAANLSNDDLAERLSYFLWSSAPDATLRELATSGRLKQPEVLREQVERMLNDPRSERFLASFLGQWLDLRNIDFTSPDSDLYPEFDALLEWSMVEETKAFLREMIRQDLSTRNLIDSDFAMLNDRLARHYGIPNVEGIAMRRVALTNDSVRGGVLTQGSVLKVTANGTTTSPVVRGVWVLERILGAPSDPPPPGVPAIEPDIRGAVTIREQLQQHRAVESCARCHAKIDPPGMALECFDVIGGFRTKYRAIDPERADLKPAYHPNNPPPKKYVRAKPVDSSDKLPDGRQFTDIHEFKKLLAANPDQIAANVVEKLVVYATGAPVSFADRDEVERIVNQTREQAHGLRSLIHAVVQSELFAKP